jgi:hypothetical protein
MKNLENGEEIVFGRTLSEIPPQPPFKKGGQGGFLARAVIQGKILAAGSVTAHLRTAFEKRSITYFSNKVQNLLVLLRAGRIPWLIRERKRCQKKKICT